MNQRPKFPNSEEYKPKDMNLESLENLRSLDLEALTNKLSTKIAVDICLDNFFDKNGNLKEM